MKFFYLEEAVLNFGEDRSNFEEPVLNFGEDRSYFEEPALNFKEPVSNFKEPVPNFKEPPPDLEEVYTGNLTVQISQSRELQFCRILHQGF